MLGETEIKLLLNLEGKKPLKEVAKKLDLSQSYTSQLVSKLQEKGLIKTEKSGKKKLVYRVENQTIENLQEIKNFYPHIQPAKTLSRKTLPLLYYLDEPMTVKELAEETGNYRNTVNRILKKLKNRGLVQKNGSQYKLNKDFKILNELAKSYAHLQHRREISSHVSTFTILWESLKEFLVQTPEEIDYKKYHQTGPELFRRFDLPLTTTGRKYYFYSEGKREIGSKDIVCHTLLIDKGTRYQSYCMLLLKKEDIDREGLVKKAERFGVEKTVKSIIKYLETRGEKKTSEQPTWGELKDLASDYGVKI
ncbi:transcriptional regulator TrmB [archaeon SCG-AAA382B04]|nr:transcriptional regulator TrmB [archaeon SCG-AAA382B04]